MLAACSSDSPAPSSTESAPVVEAPTAHPPNPLAFSAPTLDGGRFDLAERNRPTGRRVVVFLFDPSSSYPQHPTPDTRHPSSAAAILAAERLYQQRHAYNLEVVGIAVPPGYRPGRPMTNDGMTNDEWGPGKQDGPTRHSAFVIDSSFVIRHSSLAHLVRKRLADLGATFPCVVDPDGTLVERYRLAWGLHKLEALPAFYAFEAGSNEPAGRPIFAEAAAHSAEAADYLLRRVLKQFGLEVAVDVDPLAGDRPLVPDVVLTDSQGTPHRLRDYAGRLLLLVFIVRDCPRCKEQLEFLTHQLATLGDEGAGQSKITLLVVCADLSGEPLAKLIADRGYTFPVGPDPDWTLRSAFRYRGATPDTFVIAPDGRISFRHRGYSADLRSILHMEIRTLLGLPTRPLLSVESYAGDHACRICHPAQYADWTLTRHACAWETLVRLGRENDPQCVSCHVTGMQSAVGRPQSAGSGNRQSAIGNRQFARGFVSYAKTPHLAGVQCESCHGQNGCAAFARAKAAMPNARFQMPNSSTGDGKLKIGNPAPSPASPPFIPSSSDPEHRKPNTDNRVLASRCAGCHDAVHSPRFDFASYRAKALHNRAAELAGLPRVEREARLRRLCSGVRDDLFSPDAPYVGSAVCGRCHKTEYEALQDGPHTRALAALAQAAPDTPSTPRHIRGIVGLSRADCLRCHTTGYGRPGGFPAEPEEKSFTTDYTDDTDEHRQENFWVSNPGPFFSHPCDPCNPWSNLFSKRTGVFSSAHSSWVPGGGPGGEKAPVLFSAALPLTPNTASEGVGCEACHGPGKAHADDPQRPRAILRLGGTCPECNVLSICRQCHDDANSPDFDYRRDLPKARHPVGTARRGGSRTAPTPPPL